MTMTDEKRREVASRLRESAKYVSKYDDIDCVLNDILRGEEKRRGVNEDCTACRRATFVELADLIEPGAERTCRNVSQLSKDGAMFECSECGVTWHAMRYEMGVWLHENPVFCPTCGARAVKE